MKGKKISIQEYLSLGYIYLLVLGILSETIYYRFLGINILQYTTVLDVLLSPITLLTGNMVVPIALFGMIGILYLILGVFLPKIHAKYKNKKWYQKRNNIEKLDQKYAKSKPIETLLIIAAISILSFYLGLGIGKGQKISSKIDKGEVIPDYNIIFSNDKEIDIKLIGKNSLYLFYVTKNDKKLVIAPIEQNIQQIQKLDERDIPN